MALRIGSKVKIISDNENYDKYRGKVLKITHVTTGEDGHPAYDISVYPQKLFDLETMDGEEVGFSLYEYEVARA